MGLQSHLTLFVATDSHLDTCFPGWRRPLPKRRPVKEINPFTNEPITRLTWDPGRPRGASQPHSIQAARRRKKVDPILPPEHDDDRWVQEHDTPALLQTFPHFSMWGVSYRPLSELLAVLDLPDSPPARIVDCPEDEGTIDSLPEAAAAPLARLSDRELKKALAPWQKALGIKGGWKKVIETEPTEGSAWSLRRIRALAAEADRAGGNLFIVERLT